jgi:acyl carrier protein
VQLRHAVNVLVLALVRCICHKLPMTEPQALAVGPVGPLPRASIRETVHKVIGVMAQFGDRPVSDDARLAEDLDFDSLRLIELAVVVEKVFGLPALNLERALAVATVGDAVDLIAELRSEVES